MVFCILKKDLIKLLKHTSYKRGFAVYCMEMHENCRDNLSNNLRLNEIFIYIFFQLYCKQTETNEK